MELFGNQEKKRKKPGPLQFIYLVETHQNCLIGGVKMILKISPLVSVSQIHVIGDSLLWSKALFLKQLPVKT